MSDAFDSTRQVLDSKLVLYLILVPLAAKLVPIRKMKTKIILSAPHLSTLKQHQQRVNTSNLHIPYYCKASHQPFQVERGLEPVGAATVLSMIITSVATAAILRLVITADPRDR